MSDEASSIDHPLRETTWPERIALAAIAILGLALRVRGAWQQPPIFDELLSYLGAQTVAERGIPLLPSGVLYLHGTVQSYLLAPLLALGVGGPDELPPLRLVSAVAGAIALPLTFWLARVAGAAAATGLLAAALVAVDPASVLWGSYLRMYAFAQPLAIAVAIAFLVAISADPRLVSRGRSQRTLWALVILFWLAVFTHLATALLLPAMAAVVLVLYGSDLLRGRRDLTLALAGCALAPLVVIGLTGAIGPGAGTAIASRTEGLPGVSFLGEDNVNLAQILHPDPTPWTALFTTGPLALMVPLLLALASGLLVGRFLLVSEPQVGQIDRRAVGALLALTWLPILALALFATDAAERYALFLLPSGYVLLAIATESLVAPVAGRRWRGWPALGGAVLALAVLVHGVAGLGRLAPAAASAPKQAFAAEAYISQHRQPGELILTSSAVDSALLMGRIPELRFLAGGEGSQRVLRYSRVRADGEAIDYWIGMPSLTTTAALCQTLRDAPGSWLLISDRVWANWGYNDQPQRVIERRAEALQRLVFGLADQVYEDEEWIIFRSRPAEVWDKFTTSACNEGLPELQDAEQGRRDT